MVYGSQEEAFKGLDAVKHSKSFWRGAKAGADEVNAMDDVLDPFEIDSGNNTWGTALCIVGSGDTPIEAGTKFEVCHICFDDAERSAIYKIRIAWGADYATALAAGDYSEKMVNAGALPGQPIDFHMPRIPVGTKVWAACEVAANTGTLDFFIAIQEITL